MLAVPEVQVRRGNRIMGCSPDNFVFMLTYWLTRREWIMETVLDGMEHS